MCVCVCVCVCVVVYVWGGVGKIEISRRCVVDDAPGKARNRKSRKCRPLPRLPDFCRPTADIEVVECKVDKRAIRAGGVSFRVCPVRTHATAHTCMYVDERWG